MNKRQLKKCKNKIAYPLVDEYNLLTLNADEYKKAIEDYKNYCRKYYRFKCYKNKHKILKKPFIYNFPIGQATKDYMMQMLALTSRKPIKTTTVYQSLEQIKNMYD